MYRVYKDFGGFVKGLMVLVGVVSVTHLLDKVTELGALGFSALALHSWMSASRHDLSITLSTTQDLPCDVVSVTGEISVLAQIADTELNSLRLKTLAQNPKKNTCISPDPAKPRLYTPATKHANPKVLGPNPEVP